MLDAEMPIAPALPHEPVGESHPRSPEVSPVPDLRIKSAPARKMTQVPTRVTEQRAKPPEASQTRPSLYLASNMSKVETTRCASGTVVAFSRRSPEKPTTNEDACAIFPLWPGAAVLVVADGVGGMKNGSKASAAAIRAFKRTLGEIKQEQDLRNSMMDAIERANASVLRHCSGSATTIAAVEINNGYMRGYHVGDSAIMLVSARGRIKWVALAHAPVSYAIEAGVITEEEGMSHPERNLVANVLGDRDMFIEVGPRRKIAVQDTILLASDGLTDNLTTWDIADLVRRNPLSNRVAELMDLASNRMVPASPGADAKGKADDLTALVYRPERRAKSRKK